AWLDRRTCSPCPCSKWWGATGLKIPQTRMTAISCRRRTNFLYAESSPRFNHAAGRLRSRSRPADRRRTEYAPRSAARALQHLQLPNSRVSSAPALVGLGVCPSLFPFPQTRGCGAPEQTPRERTRLSRALKPVAAIYRAISNG